MTKLPPATLDDVCESLDKLARGVSDGLEAQIVGKEKPAV